MKKLLLVVSLCLLLAPVFTFASIDNNLYYGLQKNSSVTQLQEFLIDKGFLAGSSTGNFFSLTLKAVKAYQTSVGINSTGYVGTLTRTAINSDLATQLSASNAESTTETGTTPPTPTPLATTNDVIATLQAQIALLLQQVQAMQAQQATTQQIAQNTQQIVQNTQQIVQNTCTPNWQCGSWATCSGSTQTRTCTDSNNCGNNNGKPALTQSCSTPAPTPTEIVSMSLTGTYPSTIDSQNNTSLWESSAIVTNGSVIFKNITLREIGSISTGVLQNLHLYVDNVQFGAMAIQPDVNGLIGFSDSITMSVGTHNVKLIGDITGGSSRSFYISLRSSGDITMTNISGLAVSPSGLPISTSMQNISTGSLTISKADDSPSGNVTIGASDITLAKYILTAHGENIRVVLITALSSSNSNATPFKNSYFLIDGVKRSYIRDLTTSAGPYLDSPLIMNGNQSVIIETKADISGSNGDAVQFKLKISGTGQISQTSIPEQEVDGNVLTVVSQ